MWSVYCCQRHNHSGGAGGEGGGWQERRRPRQGILSSTQWTESRILSSTQWTESRRSTCRVCAVPRTAGAIRLSRSLTIGVILRSGWAFPLWRQTFQKANPRPHLPARSGEPVPGARWKLGAPARSLGRPSKLWRRRLPPLPGRAERRRRAAQATTSAPPTGGAAAAVPTAPPSAAARGCRRDAGR